MSQEDNKENSNDGSSSEVKQVTICGGGNGAHAFVVTVAAKLLPRFRVNWLSLYGDESEKINKQLSLNDGYVQGVFVQENALISGKPSIVTNDASKVIPGSDIIVLCVPAFAHTQYLDVINKYHESCNNEKSNKKLIIAAFPSACGLEFAFMKMIRNYSNNVILFNCLTLPWACRFIEYGKSVEILGVKGEIGNYIMGNNELIKQLQPLKLLQSLFLDGKPILQCDNNIHILSSTLGSTNPVIHNSIMYNQWFNYDGITEFNEKPLFYQGINENGAQLMSDLSDEIIIIANKINEIGIKKDSKNFKKIEFPHITEWYKESYGAVCKENKTLFGLIRTNPGYNGLTHPMKQSEKHQDKWVPNWKYRYLTEDIPYGLLVSKAIACILDNEGYNIKTPNLDKILLWAQSKMEKQYFLVDKDSGKMILNVKHDDIQKGTRVPQKFGINKIDDIINM